MMFLSIVLMVLGLIGIIVCQKKQKTNPNAQGLAVVCLIIILAGAGLLLWENGMLPGAGDREMDRIMANETRFTEARSKVMGEYIGKTWNGQNAVIITEPGLDKNPIAKAGVAAMEETLKKAGVNVTATEALNLPENADGPAPMEMALTAKIYNDIFNAHKDANLFIIMSQLPFNGQELQKMKCWSFNPKKQRVVLVSGEIYNLKGAIAAGFIGAAAAMKTGPEAYDPEKAAPKDVQAAFDTRFILVTPENVKDIAEKNKDLFAK
ncbi:MAG: hypothetical protein MR727_06835 [Lentisphaeria bacterium]|nr:hypothetical protein [Lentisphaeria bacterium]